MNKKKYAIITLVVVLVVGGYLYKTSWRPSGSVAVPSVPKPESKPEIQVQSAPKQQPANPKLQPVVVSPGQEQSVQALIKMGAVYEEKGMVDKAIEVYDRINNEYPQMASIDKIWVKLSDLRFKMLFSAAEQEGCVFYDVRPGDSLAKIAKQFGTTVGLIKRINHLERDVIFMGQKLKVCQIKFNIFVDKSDNILKLRSGDALWKHYTVSTGLNNSTPVGTFTVETKLIDPPWYRPGKIVPSGDPENALGSRWLGFDLKGYGIHGTIEPETIGKQITNGCVRMLNKEVEELYDIVPKGTEVTIID